MSASDIVSDAIPRAFRFRIETRLWRTEAWQSHSSASCALDRFAERAESEREAAVFRRRDGMLPARPAQPTQDVRGSRLQNLPQQPFALGIFLHGPWPKLHRAFADQRYTNDYIESWRVPMPAASGARRIIS